MSLINKYLLNTYYLLGTVLITENFNKQKEWKDTFQEKWSKGTESELKGREEEEMSEKVTGGIGWYLENATAPIIVPSKIEYKYLFLHLGLTNQSNFQRINTAIYL